MRFPTMLKAPLARQALAPTILLLLFALYSLVPRHESSLRSRGTGTPQAHSVKERKAPSLHITSIVQHGHIVELCGTTDKGATVMINGQTAATIFDANSFRYFLGPLPSGTAIATVTVQDHGGGVNTQRLAI